MKNKKNRLEEKAKKVFEVRRQIINFFQRDEIRSKITSKQIEELNNLINIYGFALSDFEIAQEKKEKSTIYQNIINIWRTNFEEKKKEI